MKSVRFTTQIIVLLLQIYFFIETLLLHTVGHAFFPFKPIESGWISMIFTLLIVLGCEIFGLIDALLAVLSKRSLYRFIYLALVLVNALLFVNFAYYSTPGTVVCLSFYAVLFLLRISHMVANFTSTSKDV